MDKLLIDIGNTAIKWQLNQKQAAKVLLSDFSAQKLPKLNANAWVLISAVGGFTKLSIIKNNYKHCQIFLAKTAKYYKKLTNAYDDIAQLGIDRWLQLIAVYEKYPKFNTLILSFGSATTLDVLTKIGQHQGGLILPSLELIKQSFSKFYKQNQTTIYPDTSVKTDTKTAWQTGCEALWYDGVLQLINTTCKTYTIDIIIISGGYTNLIIPYLPSNYKYQKNLIFSGLNFLWDNSDKFNKQYAK